jgi:hypothetical protein
VCTGQAKARAARRALKCIDGLMDSSAVDLVDADNQKGGVLNVARELPDSDRKRFTLGVAQEELNGARAWVRGG